MPSLPAPRPALAAVAMVLAGLLAACAAGTPAPRETTTGERVAAIRAARDAAGGPAERLGTAAAETAARVDDLAAQPGASGVDALEDAVAALTRARGEASEVELGSDTPDVVAADAALATAVDRADDLGRAADDLATATTSAVTTAEELAGLVGAWDERGSRSQLLARFEAQAATAQRLAAGDAPPPAGCPGPVEEARAAAAFVAEATRELRELVAGYAGDAFDVRRAELAEAPYGTAEDGTVRRTGTAIDPSGCPAIDDAATSADGVASALVELQSALNPDDLAG
jgi:hypothetical protein